MSASAPGSRAGINVAMKIPEAQFEATLAFYRDVLGFDVKRESGQGPPVSYSFSFGPMRLWLDRVDDDAHPDVWLEIAIDDLDAARRYLDGHGTHTRDEVEHLPSATRPSMQHPAGVVHLLVAQLQPG